jgi:hypothetical protein
VSNEALKEVSDFVGTIGDVLSGKTSVSKLVSDAIDQAEEPVDVKIAKAATAKAEAAKPKLELVKPEGSAKCE